MSEDPKQSSDALELGAREVALLFKLVEDAGVGCGYERSVKFVPGAVLANRFMLGVETSKIEHAEWIRICRQLQMPREYLESFSSRLEMSNVVLLGFEDGGRAGRTYKVYL